MYHICNKKNLNNFITLFLVLVLIFFISSNLIFSQTTNEKKNKKPDPTLHNEFKDDDYIPIDRESLGRSPAYKYSMSSITTVQVNVDANGLNIVGDAANEPSIAIDPNDHNKMVIGWRQFNTISSNFRQAGYGYTTNGGQTWTFPGVIQPGVFRSDPVLDYDVDGNFYYNSLTNNPDYYCKVYKSSNGGSSWDNGTDAHGGDKQWMTIDKTTGPGNGHIYAFWTSFFSTCYPGFFTRSTNNGESFENCITIPDDPSWGTLMVGPNGKLYVGASGSLDFVVARSSNAQIPGQIITWDLATYVNLDGYITYGVGVNPDGLGGQTSIAVDTSGGPYNGNVYLLCSVERNSNSDPLDVMFARSTNEGASWSSPIRINDDANTSAYQWFGTMSVAPNGRIDVIWLDTRDNPGTYLSALYYSNSTDGGLTWSANERLSGYFDPHVGWPQQQKMGDYFHMFSDSSGANLAWAATFNGEQDVYYSHINANTIVPVELLSFNSSVVGNGVTLNWLTATELNNQGFEIQRKQVFSQQSSIGKQEWDVLSFVNGNGTTTEPQSYTFADENLQTGKYQYRLKQIDFDGTFEYSNIVEVEIAPTAFSLEQNYPNPFNPSTKISWQSPVSNWQTLKIYDILGNEVAILVDEYRNAGNYSIEFNPESNIKNPASGIYFYQLRAGEYVETKKMVLLK